MKRSTYGSELPAVPRYFLLLALAAGPAHGAAVLEQIIGDTIGAGYQQRASLYRGLHRLERDGLITGRGDVAKGILREYKLTTAGRNRLATETKRLMFIVQRARHLTGI